MARPGITYLEVAQAASTIQQTGENPTIDLVRKALGTGSNTTIATHLRTWRIDHQPAVAALSKTTLPPELLTQLQSFWDALQAKSKERNDELEAEHAQQIEEHQQTIDRLTQESRSLRLERDQLSEHSGTLQLQLDTAQQKQAQSEQHQEQMLIRVNEQQRRITDKEAAIKDLKEQSKHIQHNLDHFREATRQQREELMLQHDSVQSELKQEIKRLTEQLDSDRNRSQGLILEMEKQKYKIEKLTDESHWLTEQSQERYTSIIELKTELKTIQSKNDTLNTQNSELSKEVVSKQKELSHLEHTVIEYKEKWEAAKRIEAKQAKQIEQLTEKCNHVTS